MYGIYANIYHQYTPNVGIYMPYIRIRHGKGEPMKTGIKYDNQPRRITGYIYKWL